jgi:osmotically-inducible protein OsmY
VREALLRDPYLYARHIDVDVDRGVVYLDGMIWLTDNFQDTKRIARTVPGVINVVTDLDLVRGGRR